MKRNKALSLYLLGSLGQILIVCAAVFFLKRKGFTMNYTSAIGIAAIGVGGISSALWGTIVTVKFRQTNLKTVICDFFRVKQSYKNYLFAGLFLFLDFVFVMFGGKLAISAWYLPFIMFLKHIVFGGLEEIGWRYLFQPLLQERLNYVISTLMTFVAWGIWHFLFFYIDGSLSEVSVIPFLMGLLTNCFILSALYTKTKNLWICVMTHSLINVFSQLIEGGNTYVSYMCKVLIVVFAIVLSVNEYKKMGNDTANQNRRYSDHHWDRAG